MSQETEFTLSYNRGYTDGLAMGKQTQRFKDLTDEEIFDVERRLRNNGDFCELHFARAILRKALEK
jgi:predicted DNA-binding helix-hairpin-helix protein